MNTVEQGNGDNAFENLENKIFLPNEGISYSDNVIANVDTPQALISNNLEQAPKAKFYVEDYLEDRDSIKQQMNESHYPEHWQPFEEPLNQVEYHVPYHNYAGPNTRTIARVINGDKPTTLLDAASLIHDIEYYSGEYSTADMNMVRNLASNYSIITGLVYDVMMIRRLSKYQPAKDKRIYWYLRDSVLKQGLLQNYKVTFSDEITMIMLQ